MIEKQRHGRKYLQIRASSDPVGTRTQNRLLRRQMLYPVELRDQGARDARTGRLQRNDDSGVGTACSGEKCNV